MAGRYVEARIRRGSIRLIKQNACTAHDADLRAVLGADKPYARAGVNAREKRLGIDRRSVGVVVGGRIIGELRVNTSHDERSVRAITCRICYVAGHGGIVGLAVRYAHNAIKQHPFCKFAILTLA
jgi:hypothetical protein